LDFEKRRQKSFISIINLNRGCGVFITSSNSIEDNITWKAEEGFN
jgi:hypothetical protein